MSATVLWYADKLVKRMSSPRDVWVRRSVEEMRSDRMAGVATGRYCLEMGPVNLNFCRYSLECAK